ncbi:MAG: hypothetical protein ACLT5U_16365 [Mediterraneibacter gnavus]
MENNTVKITGKIMETPEFLFIESSRRNRRKGYYKSTIEVMRDKLLEDMDVVPI